MASPFRFCRKYQTWFFVVLGVLLMFAFVVLPPIADYFASSAGQGGGRDPVVVRWKYGKITKNELQRRIQAEYIIQDFQQELVQRALAKQGRPKANPITPARDEQEIVRRLVLAKKAEQLGIVINDDAVLDFLDLISDQSFKSRDEYLAVLRKVAQDRMSSLGVLNQIKIDLLAQRMLEISVGGTVSLSPGDLWGYHKKVNRQVICDVLPVEAKAFLTQVPSSPPEEKIKALYEEGKDEYRDPLSPKPGFKIRRKAAFAYFEAVFDDFLQREVDKILSTITDEEVKKYYEDNKRL